MRYVFRVLSSDIKKSYKHSNSGVGFYTIPVVMNENTYYKEFRVLIPEYKTFIKKDSLYFVLDEESEKYDLKFLAENIAPKNITDGALLDILCDDYMYYIINKNYSHKLPHAINHFMPIGTSVYNENINDYDLDKWSDTVTMISKTYKNGFMAINPLTTDFIYPFEFKNFLGDRYVREYRGNVMMFTMSYDSRYNFLANSSDEKQYIYYYKNGELKPIYQLLDEKDFFDECKRKDKINKVKTPFLKTFNDHGLSKDTINFINEDEGYQDRIKSIYESLKEELDFKEKDPKVYFIPAIKDNRFLDIEYKLNSKQEITDDEKKYYTQIKEKFIDELVKAYNDDTIFYFSSEDLNLVNEHFKINSAIKNFIDNSDDELHYNKENNIVYSLTTYKNKERKIPILKVINTEELKILKDVVYTKWYNNKQNQFKR